MKYTLFTTAKCAWCNQLKKFLGMKGVHYETVDITHDQTKALELQKLYGATTVPILVREDGEYVVGFNIAKTLQML